ncbi:hypothetical protein Q3G72_029418 [Acer saccharum]|nr:hypothetical protein Q3G72_029418 [Acer saccharum]
MFGSVYASICSSSAQHRLTLFCPTSIDSLLPSQSFTETNLSSRPIYSSSARPICFKVCIANQKTTATDTALENFKQKWELFRVACDQAEEFVESVKQRIGSECLVDEATGSVAGKSGAATTALPPISAVRLEQMSSLKILLNRIV